MLPPPPRSTLFPYTTLFRSATQPKAARAFDAQKPGTLPPAVTPAQPARSEEHTSELQSRGHLVCRLLLEKKKKQLCNYYYRIPVSLMPIHHPPHPLVNQPHG